MKGENSPFIRLYSCSSSCQVICKHPCFPTQIESRFNPSHSRTGFSDPSARIAAISTLDKGIDAASQFLRSLLTRRNTLVPISVLPLEILARAFRFLVLKESPLVGNTDMGCIRVTHVCRDWGQVALDDSSLWAKIWGSSTMTTRWLSEMLVRAKNALLDIDLFAMSWISRDALIMSLPHLFHTRLLRILFLPGSTLHSHSVRETFSCEALAL